MDSSAVSQTIDSLQSAAVEPSAGVEELLTEDGTPHLGAVPTDDP